MFHRHPFVCALLLLLGVAACGGGAAPTVEAEAARDGVLVLRGGESAALPSPDQVQLQQSDGVSVDENGRAVLRFGDTFAIELLRDGDIQFEALPADEQSAFVTVRQRAGVSVNNFNADEEIAERFTVIGEFATINATGTRFLVVREADSPLEWVIALEAAERDLAVTSHATDATLPVTAGHARWVAPLGDPSDPIRYDDAALRAWLERLRAGQPQPEVGEVLWPPADVLANTEPLARLPAPGQPFELQGVALVLEPGGLAGQPRYSLEDCNGDGIADIAMQGGRLSLDLRPVLGRVRALDVTLLDRTGAGRGAVRAFNPARALLREQPLADAGGIQVAFLRSEAQPYHYAEVDLEDGCFLGFSLTPPSEPGGTSEPRAALGRRQGGPTVSPTLPPPTPLPVLPTWTPTVPPAPPTWTATVPPTLPPTTPPPTPVTAIGFMRVTSPDTAAAGGTLAGDVTIELVNTGRVAFSEYDVFLYLSRSRTVGPDAVLLGAQRISTRAIPPGERTSLTIPGGAIEVPESVPTGPALLIVVARLPNVPGSESQWPAQPLTITRPPDLTAALEIVGEPDPIGERAVVVPVRVLVTNKGGAPADPFKVAVEVQRDGTWFVVPFTVSGQDDSWYPWSLAPLAAGESVLFEGVVTIRDAAGADLALAVVADSCSGDELMPEYCRVEESDETNNRAQTQLAAFACLPPAWASLAAPVEGTAAWWAGAGCRGATEEYTLQRTAARVSLKSVR